MKDTMGMITDGGSSSSRGAHSPLGGIGDELVAKFGKEKEGQKKAAQEYLDKELRVGDKWYLISSGWFQKWKAYVGLESSLSSARGSPDKISNRSLLSTDGKSLRDDLTEENDYFTICEELWSYLVKVYSLTSTSDVIERYVIDDAVDEDSKGYSLKVEIRRLNVSLACSFSKEPATVNRVVTEEMSRQTPMDEVIQRMKSLFNVPSDRQVRLFYKTDNDRISPVSMAGTDTLNSTGYGVNDVILLDVQDDAGSWTVDYSQTKTATGSFNQAIPAPPPPPPATGSSSSLYGTRTSGGMTTRNNYDSITSFSNRHSEHRPGLCGLSNLGNTCFMNSAIQCMSNVPLLTDFFREGRYKKEINKQNPLGRKGEIAEAYAELVNDMWSGQNSYTIPRNFKLQLSRFAPQFTGFQQQDSHELLAFLLDGLHEDLNRVLNKPYVEMGSHVGKTDEQFAEESWQDHKKRNDSIIVDTFHGLLKSTLNCLVCSEISIKFDPFCYLSVPLPSKKERLVEIFFVPLDQSQSIVKFKLSVVKTSNIQELCAALEAHVPNVPRSRMVVCDVYTYKFFKVYENHEMVSSIRDRDDIYIYELPANLNSTDFLKVKLHMRESGYSHTSNYFGLPLFLLVPKQNLTYGTLYQHITNSMRRFLKDASASSGDEINSKLNNSLNVNDEDSEQSNDTHINEDDDDFSGPATRSRLKNEKLKAQKLFNLFIFKNDNIDNESQQQPALGDEMPFELSGKEGSGQGISVVAEFNKRAFNRTPLDNVIEHPSCSSQLVKKKDVISLSECFNLYTKTEELSEQDYWYCSKCKNHQPSTKKFDLWNLPQVLVVHLKRFSYSRYYRDKIDTLVDFPLRDLDLSNYLINKKVTAPTKYNLIAVSNHYGSLGGGHYTAYGQNRFDGRWYYFDDSSVSSSDEGSVCTNAAYLLIYLRQDLHSTHIAQNPSSQI